MLSQFNGVLNNREMIRAKCQSDKLNFSIISEVLAWLQFYFNRQLKAIQGQWFSTFWLSSILDVMMAKKSTNCLLYFSFLLLAWMICSTNGYQPTTGLAKNNVSFLFKFMTHFYSDDAIFPFSRTKKCFQQNVLKLKNL